MNLSVYFVSPYTEESLSTNGRPKSSAMTTILGSNLDIIIGLNADETIALNIL